MIAGSDYGWVDIRRDNQYSINTSEGEVKSVEVENYLKTKELEAFFASR